MEERLTFPENMKSGRGKAFGYVRNSLAVIGLVAIVGLVAVVGMGWMGRGLGVKTVFKTATNQDGSAKATLYQIDVGAMAATRTYVALSNSNVDGSERGDDVLTLLNFEEDGREINLEWKTPRLLVVTFPARGEIEHAVSNVRGIVIECVPQ